MCSKLLYAYACQTSKTRAIKFKLNHIVDSNIR